MEIPNSNSLKREHLGERRIGNKNKEKCLWFSGTQSQTIDSQNLTEFQTSKSVFWSLH